MLLRFKADVACFIVLIIFLYLPFYASAQEEETDAQTGTANETLLALSKNQEEIAAKQQEIAELTNSIKALQGKRASTVHEANIIADQMARIQRQLEKAQLELRQTKLAIKSVGLEQENTEKEIQNLGVAITEKRVELKQLIRMLYEKEQTSFIKILLSSGSFSEMMAERELVQGLQEKSIALVRELREREQKLQVEQEKLAQQKQDLAQLEQLQGVQQADLAVQRKSQEEFLRAKREEQVKYEQKIAEAEQTRKEIEQDMFTLKSAGVKMTLTEATDMARYASKLTGVRAALLLAVLKVETNLGTNIGSGKFPDDMHPLSREPFLRITKKLGLDPNTAPISARPRSYSGWGGAMGPAQVMPQTWEGIEARLGQLLNKPTPNPYELTDAFVATALLLADKGAADSAREYEAVNRYLAGPNWERFTWYGDRVLAIAKEYEKEGL